MTCKQRCSRDARRQTEICAATGRHGGRLAQAVVNTVGKAQAEVDKEMLCDTLSDAQALVDTVADSEAEVEAEMLGNTLSDAHALVEPLASTIPEVAP